MSGLRAAVIDLVEFGWTMRIERILLYLKLWYSPMKMWEMVMSRGGAHRALLRISSMTSCLGQLAHETLFSCGSHRTVYQRLGSKKRRKHVCLDGFEIEL